MTRRRIKFKKSVFESSLAVSETACEPLELKGFGQKFELSDDGFEHMLDTCFGLFLFHVSVVDEMTLLETKRGEMVRGGSMKEESMKVTDDHSLVSRSKVARSAVRQGNSYAICTLHSASSRLRNPTCF